MNPMGASTLGGLLAWGTAVGLDLVSLPQGLLSRPLVAGGVAGWIAGDPEAGIRVGAVLELFALDVLPVGAVCYPDFGPATVGAVAFAAGSSWQAALGPAVTLGLAVAAAGGWALQWVRHANARSIQARVAALAAGDPATIVALQYAGLARDAIRSAGLTALGLGAAYFGGRLDLAGRSGSPTLAAVAAAVGLAAVIGGAWRTGRSQGRLRWLGIGVLAGVVWGWLG